MIRKYHNHKPQTNPWHREEEPHNHYNKPGSQTKKSNQLSLPHQDDYKKSLCYVQTLSLMIGTVHLVWKETETGKQVVKRCILSKIAVTDHFTKDQLVHLEQTLF